MERVKAASGIATSGGDLQREGASDLTALARGGILNIVGVASNGLLNFVLILVIARSLSPADAGAFFVALAMFSILEKVAALGADTGLVRMIARYRALGRWRDIRASLEVGLWPVVVLGTLFGLLLFLNAGYLSRLFSTGPRNAAGVVPYIAALAPILPISAAFTVMLGATRGFGTMVPSVVLDKVAKPALQPLLVLLAIFLGWGSTGVALGWGFPLVVGVAFAGWWLGSIVRRAERRHDHEADTRRPLSEIASEFWRFTAPRSFAGVFQVATVWLATLFIGGLLSTRGAGIYTAATRYLVVGQLALQAIHQVMGPKISELLAKGSQTRAQSVYQTATAWLMVLAWPIYFTLAVFAPLLLEIFGPEYVAGQAALAILSLAMLLSTAIGPVDIVLLMGGKSSWNLANAAFALVLNVALNLLLIPRFGIEGAALAWAGSIAANNLLPLAQVWRFLRLHPFGKGFSAVAAAAALLYGGLGLVFRGVWGLSVPAFVAFGVISTAAYAIVLWRFRGRLELPVFLEATPFSRTHRPSHRPSEPARR